MKKYLFLFGISALLLFAFSAKDSFHTSTTNVEFNAGSTAITFSSKFVTDDLAKAVGVGIDNPSQFNSAVERYLKANFVVKINGAKKSFNYAKAQTSPKATRLYFEIPNSAAVTNIEVKNTMLFNSFPDQQNFMTFNINNKRGNFVTKKGNDTGKLSF